MKSFRPSSGPFQTRPFFEDAEIEVMCSDALTVAGYLPACPEPIRIDRFIEKHFRVRIIYEELPAGVLGYTEFGANGVEAVHIGEPKERTKSAERRMNSTIAHEGGHGLMHAYLFALGDDHGGLFGANSDVSKTRVLCRDGENQLQRKRAYDGRWWEFQADKAIGALLLPKRLFLAAIEPFVERRGTFGNTTLLPERRKEAIRAIAEIFDVNPAAAKVRVDLFFPERQSGTEQLTL